ncbi:MAG: hypothetical protein NT065_00275 [Chlamydiae bacterium]|nr:hypothetical protein [Chlamydiota bacterium]
MNVLGSLHSSEGFISEEIQGSKAVFAYLKDQGGKLHTVSIADPSNDSVSGASNAFLDISAFVRGVGDYFNADSILGPASLGLTTAWNALVLRRIPDIAKRCFHNLQESKFKDAAWDSIVLITTAGQGLGGLGFLILRVCAIAAAFTAISTVFACKTLVNLATKVAPLATLSFSVMCFGFALQNFLKVFNTLYLMYQTQGLLGQSTDVDTLVDKLSDPDQLAYVKECLAKHLDTDRIEMLKALQETLISLQQGKLNSDSSTNPSNTVENPILNIQVQKATNEQAALQLRKLILEKKQSLVSDIHLILRSELGQAFYLTGANVLGGVVMLPQFIGDCAVIIPSIIFYGLILLQEGGDFAQALMKNESGEDPKILESKRKFLQGLIAVNVVSTVLLIALIASGVSSFGIIPGLVLLGCIAGIIFNYKTYNKLVEREQAAQITDLDQLHERLVRFASEKDISSPIALAISSMEAEKLKDLLGKLQEEPDRTKLVKAIEDWNTQTQFINSKSLADRVCPLNALIKQQFNTELTTRDSQIESARDSQMESAIKIDKIKEKAFRQLALYDYRLALSKGDEAGREQAWNGLSRYQDDRDAIKALCLARNHLIQVLQQLGLNQKLITALTPNESTAKKEGLFAHFFHKSIAPGEQPLLDSSSSDTDSSD